jgi:hypothetical protein
MHKKKVTVAEAKQMVREYRAKQKASWDPTGFYKNVEGVILDGIMKEGPDDTYDLVDDLALFCIMAGYSPGAAGPATSYMVNVSKTLERVGKGQYRRTGKAQLNADTMPLVEDVQ